MSGFSGVSRTRRSEPPAISLEILQAIQPIIICTRPDRKNDIFLDRVRRTRFESKPDCVDHLIHGARRFGPTGLADDLGGNAGHGHVVRHRLDHHRSRGDAGTMTDLDVAENFRARPDQYAMADFGMTVFVFLAGAAKGDAVQDRDIVFDDSSLAAYEPCGVIEKDAA